MRLNRITRSSGVSLKYANAGKRAALEGLRKGYQGIIGQVVDALWDYKGDIQRFCPDIIDNRIVTDLTARYRQCASKQAVGIVKSILGKVDAITRRAADHKANGRHRKARDLLKKANELRNNKPDVTTVNPELDSRFVDVQDSTDSSFDGWAVINNGIGGKVTVPFRRHRHLEKMEQFGEQTTGLRLEQDRIVLIFHKTKPDAVKSGAVIGIDVGQTDAITCSTGQIVSSDAHGHTYKSICEKIAAKKPGSRAFEKAARQRKNYCGWVVNQLNLVGVKQLNRENILHLKRGKNTSRSLKAWSYRELFDRVDNKAQILGVQVRKLSPTYTSQRCSQCGWVQKGNRSRKQFCCLKCGHTQDADSNASANLSFELPALNRQQWRKGANRTGFYWHLSGSESIVPAARKLSE